MALDAGAFERWDSWYLASIGDEGDNEAEDDMRARHGNLVMKVALIFAVSDWARAVEKRHLDPALALVEWMWSQVRDMIKIWGVGIDSQISARITIVLRKFGPQVRREIQQRSKSGKWGPRDFAATFDAMAKNGTIVADSTGLYEVVE